MGKKNKLEKKLEKLLIKVENVEEKIKRLKEKKIILKEEPAIEHKGEKHYTGDRCHKGENFLGFWGCGGKTYYLPSRGCLPITKCEKCGNVWHLSTLD
jgi:DNA-directed RNA polymerase subunit M/transcription elongation factor TFIIS